MTNTMIHGFGEAYVAQREPLSWLDLARLPDSGTRVVFVADYPVYEFCTIPAGTAGVVTSNELNEITCHLEVMPDNEDLRMDLDDWGCCAFLGAHLNPAADMEAETEDEDVAEWNKPSPLALESGLTFAEFQATGRAVADLVAEGVEEQPLDDDLPIPGRVYEGGLHIEERPSQGWPNGRPERWFLILSNADWLSDDLEALERELYQYYLSECV